MKHSLYDRQSTSKAWFHSDTTTLSFGGSAQERVLNAPRLESSSLTPVRQRLGHGPSVALVAVTGAILAALPYFGLGPDTSPDASTYVERRYGNIGLGLAAMWLCLMAAIFIVGLALTIVHSLRHGPKAASTRSSES